MPGCIFIPAVQLLIGSHDSPMVCVLSVWISPVDVPTSIDLHPPTSEILGGLIPIQSGLGAEACK